MAPGMSGFSPTTPTPAAVPWWLQLVLGVFQILEPQFAWIAQVIVLAYQIWQALPFLHKTAALGEFRQAVKLAKLTKTVEPVNAFAERWKPFAMKGK